MMTTTPLLTLTNAHGLFEVEVRTLSRAIAATRHRSDALIRIQTAAHCGYGDFDIEDSTPLDNCSRIELLAIWIESGNHTF